MVCRPLVAAVMCCAALCGVMGDYAQEYVIVGTMCNGFVDRCSTTTTRTDYCPGIGPFRYDGQRIATYVISRPVVYELSSLDDMWLIETALAEIPADASPEEAAKIYNELMKS